MEEARMAEEVEKRNKQRREEIEKIQQRFRESLEPNGDPVKEEAKQRGPKSYYLVVDYLGNKFKYEDYEYVPNSELYPPSPPTSSIYAYGGDCGDGGASYDPVIHLDGLEIYKRFLKQVRETNGYDVDCIPGLLQSVFFPMTSDLCEVYMDEITMCANYAIVRINEEMGRGYELVRVEKVVSTGRHYCYLMTFCVKDKNDGTERVVRAMVGYPSPRQETCILEEWSFIPPPTKVSN